MEKEKKCPLCSYEFVPAEQGCRASCLLGSGCHVLRCPRCGYHFVDEDHSWVVRTLRRLFRRGEEHA